MRRCPTSPPATRIRPLAAPELRRDVARHAGQAAGRQPVGRPRSQLTTGALQWPKPYPTVFKPDTSGVDDLWHAAINGRGRFVNAQSVDELKLGIGQILQDVTNQAGARAGRRASRTSTFRARQQLHLPRPVRAGLGRQPDQGADQSDHRRRSGERRGRLRRSSPRSCRRQRRQDTPWFTERKIVTVNETGNAVPFLWGNLGANQQDSLCAGQAGARPARSLEFLRGNRRNEGSSVGQFRVRVGGLLGDIVDSSPVYVGVPQRAVSRRQRPGLLDVQVGASPAVPARVYVGANDGMLHVFDDATGNETWAYIPRGSRSARDKTGLGALAYQDGALPPFKHHFYVDSTPRDHRRRLRRRRHDWHTHRWSAAWARVAIRYYALDVTDPAEHHRRNRPRRRRCCGNSPMPTWATATASRSSPRRTPSVAHGW